MVIGTPDFSGTGAEVEKPQIRSYRNFPYGIPPLPGAELEAKEVAHVLGTEAVVGSEATERYIKGLRSPQVLHIATHGYFCEAGTVADAGRGLTLCAGGTVG